MTFNQSIDTNEDEISFVFQQKKFILNPDKKQFEQLLYPSDTNHTVKPYQDIKGLTSKKEIEYLTHTYGLNK